MSKLFSRHETGNANFYKFEDMLIPSGRKFGNKQTIKS